MPLLLHYTRIQNSTTTTTTTTYNYYYIQHGMQHARVQGSGTHAWGPHNRACIGPVHACMGTPQVWGPRASMCAWARCKHASVRARMTWCMRAWGPRERAGMGTQCEQHAQAQCVHACIGPVRVCMRAYPASAYVHKSSRHGHRRAGIRQGLHHRHPTCQ